MFHAAKCYKTAGFSTNHSPCGGKLSVSVKTAESPAEMPGNLDKIRRKMLLNNQDRREAEEFIRKTDKRRKTSYDYYTGKKWGNPADFDICINSACYGIDGTVDLLERLVQYSLDKK